MDQIRVGILGTGFMSRVHSQAVLANGGVIVGFVGSSIESAQQTAQIYAGARAFRNIDELLAAGVDAVHVCTPNSLHAEQARAIIASGTAVVCEKPLAVTVDEAETLHREAVTASVVNAVPFIYRYYSAVRAIKSRIRNDQDNPVWLLHGSYLQDWLASSSASNWRVEPGRGGASRAFGDIGVHWCDLMEFVTGQRITAVNAQLGRAFVRAGGSEANSTEDGGAIQFRTDAGAIGSLVVSQASAGRKNRLYFSFDGPRTSYSFDQENPEFFWQGQVDENRSIIRDPVREDPASPGHAHQLPAGHPQGYQTCFNEFVADVHAAIRGVETSHPTFADGLRAARVTDAVLNSSRSGEWADVSSSVLSLQ